MRLHDVIHDYLRACTSRADQARLHRALLDAYRAGVPTVAGMTAWWELPARADYMWSWTVAHLAAAGLQCELDNLVCYSAWIAARLNRDGPEAVLSDLKHGSAALSKQLADAVRQSAHLLGALSPEGSVVATLASRLPQTPESAAVARGLTAGLAAPHLVMTAPAPDLPHPALGRVLPGSVPIHFLVPLPRARRLATAAWDWGGKRCTVTVWDPTTGKRLRDLDGVSAPLTTMTADPGGRWIAAADGQSVWVWGTEDGRLRRTYAGGAHKLMSLGGGRWLVTLDPAELRVLDPMTGDLLRTFRCEDITFDDVVADPTGTWLAVQSKGYVVIVEPATGTVISRVAHPIRHTGYFPQTGNRMAAAPDGSWLAAAGGDALLLWTRDRNEWNAISYPYLNRLAADPRGRWIALLSESSVAVWDTARWNLRWGWCYNTRLNDNVLIDPQGQWLAMGGRSVLNVFNAGDGETILHFDGRTTRLTCDPTGRFLAAIRPQSSIVYLWEISTGHLLHTLWHAGWVTELTADPHGRWFASADDHGDVRVWNWPPPDLDALDALSSAQDEGVAALAADPELRCLATVDNAGSLRLWDADTGTMRYRPRPAYRKALAVAPNGAWVATTHKGRLEILDVPNGLVRHTIEGVHSSRVVAIPHWNAVAAFVPFAIRVWNADSGQPMLDFPHSSGGMNDLLADPLGRWFAVAGDDALRIWSLPSGEQIAVIDGFVESPVTGAGGRWIVGVRERGQIEIWDSATGKLLRSLTGSNKWVRGVAVDSHGRWIASRHDDHLIDLWDVELGSRGRVHTLGKHPGIVTFAPSPREGLLASAGKDGTIKLWHPQAGRLIASLRVSAAIWHLCWTDERLIAAGAYGPYVLRLSGGTEPRLGYE